MVSETKPEVVRRNLETFIRRRRRRGVGEEEEGRGTEKGDREEETGAEDRTSEAGETETADQVEGGRVGSKEEGWGEDSVSSEEVARAGWETTGKKKDLIIVWLDEVAGCFFVLCRFGLRGGRGEA
jgi:hypothetical protein